MAVVAAAVAVVSVMTRAEEEKADEGFDVVDVAAMLRW